MNTEHGKFWPIWTPANAITLLGIFLGGLSFWFLSVYIYQNRDVYYFFWATIFYLLAILTDYVDGKVARFFAEIRPSLGISPLGEILDPLRDKILAGILFVIHWKLAFIFLGLEIVSFVFALKVRRTVGYHLITLPSKILTFFQLPLILVLLLSIHFLPLVTQPLFIGIISITVFRPISYVYSFISIKNKEEENARSLNRKN